MYILRDQRNLGGPIPPSPGPLLVASLLSTVDRRMPFRGHAIKYVLRGEERYTVNGRPFAIRSGQYLVANPHSTGRITIDSPSVVVGLCADLPTTLIDGMVCACTRPDEIERTTLNGFFNSGEFLENSYADRTTHVGQLMRRLALDVHSDPYRSHAITSDMYLQLAEAYVSDHRPLVPLLSHVNAVRTSTRKEILRGLERARNMIHDHLSETVEVDQLAQEAGMSTFHFFRAFRCVHSITPHQYRNNLRLAKAAHLLAAGRLAAWEIAAQCGFADKTVFSKAFKKKYGVPPSAMRTGSRRI